VSLIELYNPVQILHFIWGTTYRDQGN